MRGVGRGGLEIFPRYRSMVWPLSIELEKQGRMAKALRMPGD